MKIQMRANQQANSKIWEELIHNKSLVGLDREKFAQFLGNSICVVHLLGNKKYVCVVIGGVDGDPQNKTF